MASMLVPVLVRSWLDTYVITVRLKSVFTCREAILIARNREPRSRLGEILERT